MINHAQCTTCSLACLPQLSPVAPLSNIISYYLHSLRIINVPFCWMIVLAAIKIRDVCLIGVPDTLLTSLQWRTWRIVAVSETCRVYQYIYLFASFPRFLFFLDSLVPRHFLDFQLPFLIDCIFSNLYWVAFTRFRWNVSFAARALP
jgi:hypothetical protein